MNCILLLWAGVEFPVSLCASEACGCISPGNFLVIHHDAGEISQVQGLGDASVMARCLGSPYPNEEYLLYYQSEKSNLL